MTLTRITACLIGGLLCLPAAAQTVTTFPAAPIGEADSGFGPQVANVAGDMRQGEHLSFTEFAAVHIKERGHHGFSFQDISEQIGR